MDVLFSILVVSCIVAAVVLAIMFLIRLFLKGPKKWIGLSLLFCVVGAILFSIIGSQVWLNSMTPEEREAYYAEQQLKAEQREAERLAKEQEEATLPSETPLVAGTSWTMSGVTPTSTSGEADNSFYEAETVSELMEDIVSDGIIEKLISFGFTSEEARDIRKTFIMCGVTNIDACEPADPATTIDGLVVFRGVLDKDRIFWFTVDHREVFYIALNGVDVYDKDKGGFIININDIHVPVSDVEQDTFYKLQDLATAAVDNYLKYPNSAYYDAWAVAREDNKYMIQGEVQARNALNAKDWLVFKVWFDDAGGDFTIEGIVIDGERVR